MIVLALVLAAHAAEILPPQAAVVKITGMDCAGCQVELQRALEALEPVKSAQVSFDEGAACVTLDGAVTGEALQAAIVKAGFASPEVSAVAECPVAFKPAARKDPWTNPGDLDVKIISTGDAVKLEEHVVAGKFTIVDFGASWCGPCHTAAADLTVYLDHHADAAVRAISLPGADPKASFASAVAKQHLALAPGLPWFVVYGPDGKKLYEGGEVAKAIATVDKKRSK